MWMWTTRSFNIVFKFYSMGMIHAEIELSNAAELAMAQQHKIGMDEVKHICVEALVDTGALMLCINENIQQVLQLPVTGQKVLESADGRRMCCDIVGPIHVRFGTSKTCCRAIVLPDDAEPLLGAIPLEDLGAIIDVQRQQLIENPDPIAPLKGLR